MRSPAAIFSESRIAHSAVLVCGLLVGCGANRQGSPPQSPEAATPAAAKRAPLPADTVLSAALPLHGLTTRPGQDAPTLWDEQNVWSPLEDAHVICFGEQHNEPAHHYAQLLALRHFAERAQRTGRPLAVGFEMFQRPFQQPLSQYAAGYLSEEQFLEESEFSKRWGFDIALYRPLLQLAREYDLTSLALNAPKEVTRPIGRRGLEQLPEAARRELPELDLQDPRHRAYFDRAMGDHPMPPGGPALDDMYAAQVVWDETMAETSANWLKQQSDPRATLLIFAGTGHCHHSAIPARIERRTDHSAVGVAPVLRSKLQEAPELNELYDLVVVLED